AAVPCCSLRCCSIAVADWNASPQSAHRVPQRVSVCFCNLLAELKLWLHLLHLNASSMLSAVTVAESSSDAASAAALSCRSRWSLRVWAFLNLASHRVHSNSNAATAAASAAV
ncbi:hypothetical protein PFISCL1PPCAC_12497, partial [Pristionchus fissidentatus]